MGQGDPLLFHLHRDGVDLPPHLRLLPAGVGGRPGRGVAGGLLDGAPHLWPLPGLLLDGSPLLPSDCSLWDREQCPGTNSTPKRGGLGQGKAQLGEGGECDPLATPGFSCSSVWECSWNSYGLWVLGVPSSSQTPQNPPKNPLHSPAGRCHWQCPGRRCPGWWRGGNRQGQPGCDRDLATQRELGTLRGSWGHSEEVGDPAPHSRCVKDGSDVIIPGEGPKQLHHGRQVLLATAG